jgi:hypothetical protein
MGQRRQPPRRPAGRRPPRRGGRLLAKLAVWAAILTALVGLLSWRSETKATDREHESRQAREVLGDYKELSKHVGRWYNGAKFVYRASLRTWQATGRWPPGSNSDEYAAVIDAGTEVGRLQAGVRDRPLVRLLNALRSDIKAVCAATSAGAANRASRAMVGHWEDVNARIEDLKDARVKRLQVVG